MVCVHFGPGQLGLGLIVEQLLEVGFDVCLVGRPDARPREQKRFRLEETGVGERLPSPQVRWAKNPATFDDLPKPVAWAVREDGPLLISAALGDHIAEAVGLLREILDERPAGAPTLLLGCENEFAKSYDDLESSYADLLVLRCVVDRICAWRLKKPRDSKGLRFVQFHPVGEWLVPVEGALPEPLARLAGASMVSLIEGSMDGWRKRKLWAVNGTHIVLALVARLAGTDVDPPLEEEHALAFVELATPLIEQVVRGVNHNWPEVEIDESYVYDRIRAFSESPDSTKRLIGKYLVRGDLRPFMKRLNQRVADAARAARSAGEDGEAFYEAMALVVQVMRDPSLYYPDAATPSEDVDEEAVKLFDNSLDWLDDRRREDLVAGLRLALAGERRIGDPVRP
jgi:hypothetical protein